MNFLKQYRIPFTGLKNGPHEFDFEVDKRFFDEFDYSIVKDGKLNVILTLDKGDNMLILNFSIDGTIDTTCNLCLNQYPELIQLDERLIVKFQEEDNLSETTEEIMVLSKSDYELDIAPWLYEYINLAVPINNRCDNPGNESYCDQDMIAKINAFRGSEEEKQEQNDPRWDILKNIKNN